MSPLPTSSFFLLRSGGQEAEHSEPGNPRGPSDGSLRVHSAESLPRLCPPARGAARSPACRKGPPAPHPTQCLAPALPGEHLGRADVPGQVCDILGHTLSHKVKCSLKRDGDGELRDTHAPINRRLTPQKSSVCGQHASPPQDTRATPLKHCPWEMLATGRVHTHSRAPCGLDTRQSPASCTSCTLTMCMTRTLGAPLDLGL